MHFTTLLSEAGLTLLARHGDAEIIDICEDSRKCGEGSCFVAVRGHQHDGHDFISSLPPGVKAVVCEDGASVPAGVACAVVGDSRDALGRLAQALHGWPCRKLTSVAVTGTNGKTTVTHVIRSILQKAGFHPGMLGTVVYDTCREVRKAGNTTPGAVELAEICVEMVGAGADHLVMEISSHGLDQQRAAGIEFQAAVFTNLTGDHLDYHGTRENYLAAKALLFESLTPGATAILNRDDPSADMIAARTEGKIRWFGLSPVSDVWARIEHIDGDGTVFEILWDEKHIRTRTPLIGRHNVYNCLAAVCTCRALGVELETAAGVLPAIHAVPGRLEQVESKAGYRVYVDYAHTDDALANAIGALRPIIPGRVIVVFGCGGDRDRTKRPRMAAVAQDLADVVVVTSDNPRTEDPGAIIQDILEGIENESGETVHVEQDRRKAIDLAVNMAGEGDCILIAGKGHETEQLIGKRRVYFNDVEEARGAVKRREGG